MESKLEILTEVLKQMACASAIPYFWGFFFFFKARKEHQQKDRLASLTFEIGRVGVGQPMNESKSLWVYCAR